MRGINKAYYLVVTAYKGHNKIRNSTMRIANNKKFQENFEKYLKRYCKSTVVHYREGRFMGSPVLEVVDKNIRIDGYYTDYFGNRT